MTEPFDVYTEAGARLMIGRVVKLTEEDLRQLHKLAEKQEFLIRAQPKRWFADFVRCQTTQNVIIKTAIERSHAS